MDNLTLRPGINNVSLHANIQQQPVLTAAGTRPYCENGIIPFQLGGKDVVNNGQRIPYFADALASANQTVDINIGAALKKSLNIDLQCA
jgi:hypothetical protein